MAVLQPHEFDMSYFTGGHPAGYSNYQRWYRYSSDILPSDESTGEYFSDIAKKFKLWQFLDTKKVLELGCAYGVIVQMLRENGIQAWGMDISEYAISQADPGVQPYLINSDVRGALPQYPRNAFNVVFSHDFLCCFSESDLNLLIIQMNKIGFLQVHFIRDDYNPDYYISMPVSWWLGLGFKKGTILILNNDFNNFYKV